MTVSIRKNVTFARLVYESIGHPDVRPCTPWTPDRHVLKGWELMHSNWASHRLVYIERCRLKEVP